MKAIAFDTLAYANKLMNAGFTKEQAEVQTEAMAELINDNLAPKRIAGNGIQAVAQYWRNDGGICWTYYSAGEVVINNKKLFMSIDRAYFITEL